MDRFGCHSAPLPAFATLPPYAMQHTSSVGLVVMGEGDQPRPLLIHRISPDNAYQRQGGERCLHTSSGVAYATGEPVMSCPKHQVSAT